MFSAFRTTGVGAVALSLAQFASPAQAAYVVTLLEVPAGGGITNVVATGSGTIDLTGLTFIAPNADPARIRPSLGDIQTGPAFPTQSPEDLYTGFTGPPNFGSGGTTLASSGSGDIVILFDALAGGVLSVPLGYTSGNPLSDTATYNDQTFTSLGATPGIYKWTWGTGADADSFTLQIGPAAIPEPTSLTLLAMSLASLGVVLRTRRS
jgi:hypothetical protein